MTDLIRRSRGIGIAVVVLALSAGVVFAGGQGFAPAADSVAEVETTAETTTVETTTETTTTETTTTETTTTETTTTETSTTETTGDAAADNHGALVSAAAQLETPAGFANHGAFVSCVAKMGKDVVATGFDWASVTPESCGLTVAGEPTSDDPAASSQHGKAKGKANAQGGKGKAGTAKGKAGR